MANTATQSQIDLIQTLQNERVWQDFSATAAMHMRPGTTEYAAGALVNSSRRAWREGRFDKALASRVIDALMKCDRKDNPVEMTVDQAVSQMRTNIAAKVPAGRYAITSTNDGSTDFYRVTKTKRVLLQVSDSETYVSASHARSVLERVAEDPKAAALRYGREIGACGVCGRTLTDEESRAAGIGPVCREKTGW